MSRDLIIVLIVLGLAVTTSLYALILHHIQDKYLPDHTDVTVIIGEMLIGVALGLLCVFGVLPWSSAGYFILLQMAGGVPILIWQHLERIARRQERKDAAK